MEQHSDNKNSVAIDLREFKVSWRFIILALIGVATSASVIPLYGFGAMVKPLEEAFGWRRSDLIATATFAYLGAIFSSQLAGVLNRRYGIKPVTIISLVALSLMFLLLSQLDLFGNSIWILYGLFFLITFAGVGTLQVTWTQIINLWFEKNRGLALAIILSGSGFAGLILPSMVTAAVSAWSWRAGFIVMAALPLIITLPLALLWLSSSKTAPVVAQNTASDQVALPGVAFRTGVRSWRYWVINISMVLVSAAVIVMVINTVPMLQDKGYSAAEASRIFGALGASLVFGRVMVGYLVDRLWAPGVAFVTLTLPGLGCLLLVTMSGNPSLVVLGVAMVGIGAGAEFDLAAFLVARYFGMRDYGRLFGLQMAIISAGVAVTPAVSALLYQVFGNYDFVLMLNTILFLVGAAILLSLGRYPRFVADTH
ncbi:MAG: Permease of the major facilitator superfamily [Verrucomicrobiaceae bacterium]|nr:Permease of the major facilitator superfamily [Verrucomicrobiaceae bacterium]